MTAILFLQAQSFVPINGNLICQSEMLMFRAIHRDADLYPDGDTYNPDRWLDPAYPTFQTPLTVFPNLTNYSIFGFGRRSCPGMNIAERSAHLLTARILWSCVLRKKRDANGNDIDIPLYAYTSGFNTQPEPFLFDVFPRNQTRKEVVELEYREALEMDRAHKDLVIDG
jgi:Cytochrome P450